MDHCNKRSYIDFVIQIVPGFFIKKEKLSRYKDSNFKNVLAERSGDRTLGTDIVSLRMAFNLRFPCRMQIILE